MMTTAIMGLHLIIVALFLSPGLPEAVPAQAGKPDYVIVAGRGADRGELNVTKEEMVATIDSSRGIGRATLRLGRDGVSWPERIVLQLRLDKGKPLKELEGLTIQGKTLRVMGSRRTSGKMDAFDLNSPDGNTRRPSRKVDVKVEKTGTAMKVVIPGKLLVGEDQIQIQWVDYYR